MWLEGNQVEGEQEEVFVDQGQEQEPFAEGKPFIHAYPLYLCFTTCIVLQSSINICATILVVSFGLGEKPYHPTKTIQVPKYYLCIHLELWHQAMP